MDKKRIKIVNLLEGFIENKSLNILDVGCGYGDITNRLFKEGYQIEGFDSDRIAINKAKKDYNYINFWVADVLDVDYSKYDLLFAWSVIYYTKKPLTTINKIYDDMKEDGVFVFSTPNICALRKRIKCLLGKTPLLEYTYPILPLTFKGAKELMDNSKFTNYEIIPFDFHSSKFLKNLSTHIIIVCRKENK